MVQIDFYDDCLSDSLVPVKTMRPDKVIFLVDKRRQTQRRVLSVLRAVEAWGIRAELCPTDPDDMARVAEDLEILLNTEPEAACIDLSGGTPLMTVCGLRAAMKHGLTPTLLDSRKEKLQHAVTGETVRETEPLTIEDILRAAGGKRLKDSHDLPEPEEYDRILCMGNILFSHLNAWLQLYQYLSASSGSAEAGLTVRLGESFEKHRSKDTDYLLDAFEDQGFWEKTEERVYRFTSDKYRRYMTTYGIWLEMVVYICAVRRYGEAALGVTVDWDDTDGVDTGDNEIDVMFMYRSAPVLISCKMTKPVSGTVYEVSSLARRMAGEEARAVIATTWPVSREGSGAGKLKARLKRMRVGLIEASELGKRPLHETFNHALQTD